MLQDSWVRPSCWRPPWSLFESMQGVPQTELHPFGPRRRRWERGYTPSGACQGSSALRTQLEIRAHWSPPGNLVRQLTDSCQGRGAQKGGLASRTPRPSASSPGELCQEACLLPRVAQNRNTKVWILGSTSTFGKPWRAESTGAWGSTGLGLTLRQKTQRFEDQERGPRVWLAPPPHWSPAKRTLPNRTWQAPLREAFREPSSLLSCSIACP